MHNQDKELTALKKRISKLKPVKHSGQKNPNDKLQLLSIGTELVSGVLVGLITGIFLDKMFTTKPLLLIICLVFGSIASGKIIWQKIKNSRHVQQSISSVCNKEDI